MGTSGLFEPWRIVEVGAVAWFYAGDGGAYDYWPEGLGGPIDHDDDGTWTIRDGTTVVATHPDADVRISVLWKARPAVVPADPPPLRPEEIVAIIDADLARRGATRDHHEHALDDDGWLRYIHDTYYPDITGDHPVRPDGRTGLRRRRRPARSRPAGRTGGRVVRDRERSLRTLSAGQHRAAGWGGDR